jgi:hypothetical protein
VLLLLQTVAVSTSKQHPSVSENLNLIFFAGEKSVSELLEAFFWLLSVMLYGCMIIKYIKNQIITAWYVFLFLFCFIALGEETSWGGHLLGVSPFDFLKAINDQHESNFHNIDLARILNIPQNHYLYYYLENIARFLNPLFYILFVFFWLVLPLLKKKNLLPDSNTIQKMPVPSFTTTTFFLITLIGYLIIDNMLFDVGEIFELVLSIVAFMTAIDMWTTAPETESI